MAPTTAAAGCNGWSMTCLSHSNVLYVLLVNDHSFTHFDLVQCQNSNEMYHDDRGDVVRNLSYGCPAFKKVPGGCINEHYLEYCSFWYYQSGHHMQIWSSHVEDDSSHSLHDYCPYVVVAVGAIAPCLPLSASRTP